MGLKIFLKAIVVVGFLTQFQANAQMYVGPNTFVYVNDQVLCVTNALELNAANTSNLYLRNGGQLVQNHLGASQNSGAGSLSVYQEGVADVHQYNYWCSPVGDPASPSIDPQTNNSTANGQFKISMLGRPTNVTTTIPVTILTGTNYDGATFTGTAGNGYNDAYLKIASYWIHTFDPGSAYGEWDQAGGGYIPSGQGFTMKGVSGTDTTVADAIDKVAYAPDYVSGSVTYNSGIPNNPDGKHQRYDFRGRPNDGDIKVKIASNGDKGLFSLVGNPYPSAIDLEEFFSEEPNFTNTDQTAYFWEQGNTPSHYLADYLGGYGVYAPFGGNPVYVKATFLYYDESGNPKPCSGCYTNTVSNPNRGIVPVGQGFMVKADPKFVTSTAFVKFTNSQRTYQKEGATGNGSVFSRQKDPLGMPQIRFSTTVDNGPIEEMVQVFVPESTTGIDKGKDVVNPNNYPSMVNFLVSSKRCVISAVPFDINRKIALIFDNKKEANYKMTVKEMINLDQVNEVYLHDKIADVYYDIKNGFCDLTLPAGMNYKQYEITFKKGQVLGVDDLTEKSFEIYQDNAAKKIIVSNPVQKDIVLCDLYDIAGKLIFSKKHLGSESSYMFSTADLRDGIYIVKVMSEEDKIKTQKIIVKQ